MVRIVPWARHGFLILLAALTLFPIFFLMINSMKSQTQFTRSPLGLPTSIQFDGYTEAITRVIGPILNSSIIVSLSVVGILLCASLSAYAFTFLSFPGRRVLFTLIFALLLIPGVLTLIPLYLQIQRLDAFGISGGYGALILPYIAAGQAFSIFVLRTFFGGISQDLVDAARVDGASELHIYAKIVLPLSVPVLASVAVVNIVPLWNDYLLPSLLLERTNRTLTMALVEFQGNAQTHTSTDFGALMAAYAISCVPLAIVFAFLMRYYVQGLTSGALKL
jgi:ABC-type glycerol-3-phosphate transport system permease component